VSSNNVGHLITKPVTKLQHFPTLHHTSFNYTSLHLSTLHFLSFTFHYPLIWVNPLTFPIVTFHLTSLNYTQYIFNIQTYFQNNEPLHRPKEPLTIPLHFTFNYLFIFFTYPINSSLCCSYLHLTSLHFTFLHFLLFIAFTSLHWFSLP